MFFRIKVVDQATDQSTSSVLIFGDPSKGKLFGSMLDNKIKSICHIEDECHDKSNPSLERAHKTHGQDAHKAVSFILGKAGFGVEIAAGQ